MNNFKVKPKKLILRSSEAIKIYQGITSYSKFKLSVIAFANKVSWLLNSSDHSNPLRIKIINTIESKIIEAEDYLYSINDKYLKEIEDSESYGFSLIDIKYQSKSFKYLFKTKFPYKIIDLIMLFDEITFNIRRLQITGITNKKISNQDIYNSKRKIRSILHYGFNTIHELNKNTNCDTLICTNHDDFNLKIYRDEVSKNIQNLIGTLNY